MNSFVVHSECFIYKNQKKNIIVLKYDRDSVDRLRVWNSYNVDSFYRLGFCATANHIIAFELDTTHIV